MEKDENKDFHGAQPQDLFTKMMFGNVSSRHVQEQEDQEQNDTRRDDYLSSSPDRSLDNENTKGIEQSLQNLLANVDIDELIKNIDTLKNSASQFKPLLTKLSPLINKWIK